MEISKHMGARAIAAINRIGDRMIPGGERFPAFSDSGCVRHIDRLADYMPEPDRGDLRLLLTLLSFLPGFALGGFLNLLEKSSGVPDWLGGGLLRMIRLGLRGVVMSLYYGDPGVLEKLEYKVGVYKD